RKGGSIRVRQWINVPGAVTAKTRYRVLKTLPSPRASPFPLPSARGVGGGGERVGVGGAGRFPSCTLFRRREGSIRFGFILPPSGIRFWEILSTRARG